MTNASTTTRTKSHQGNSHTHDAVKPQPFYHQAADKLSSWYEGSLKTVDNIQDKIKHQSEELTTHVRKNPLSSLLIAAGIGFILSSLLRK